MVNRKTGVAGFYSAAEDKLLSERFICKRKQGL